MSTSREIGRLQSRIYRAETELRSITHRGRILMAGHACDALEGERETLERELTDLAHKAVQFEAELRVLTLELDGIQRRRAAVLTEQAMPALGARAFARPMAG